MEIKMTIKIRNLEEWDVNWDNQNESINELGLLSKISKVVISEHLGIDLSSLSVKSELTKNTLDETTI